MTIRPPISALIFDLDGVLYEFAPAARAAYLAEQSGLDPARISAVFRSGFEEEAEAGAYATGAAYLAGFNLALGSAISREQWVEARRRAMRLRPAMLALAAQFAGRLPVGVLTNNGALLQETLAELCAPLWQLARERCWVSCQLGARKPEPAVFARLAERLALPAGQILFVDDSAANCEGARAAGLQAFHFREEAATLEALTRVWQALGPP